MHKRRMILKKRVAKQRPPVDAGNVYQGWKGAVEPAWSQTDSVNEYQAWKGAVEPGA